jgi:hypothetical protein
VTGRRGRRRRELLDDLMERRGYSHLKEEALGCTMWRARFRRGFGPVVRQTTKQMNIYIYCIYIHHITCRNTTESSNLYQLICPYAEARERLFQILFQFLSRSKWPVLLSHIPAYLLISTKCIKMKVTAISKNYREHGNQQFTVFGSMTSVVYPGFFSGGGGGFKKLS